MTCFDCGLPAAHQHHVVPRVMGGTRTIPLCGECHGKVHGLDFTNHRALTRAGIEKARAKGVLLGNRTGNRNSDTTAAQSAWKATTKAKQAEAKNACLELIAEHGELSTRKLADHLNQAGYKTATGKQWNAPQVWRIMKFLSHKPALNSVKAAGKQTKIKKL